MARARDIAKQGQSQGWLGLEQIGLRVGSSYGQKARAR